MNVLSFSEVGGHAVNEDAFAVERHPADPGCWVCCLADGQGGRAGGACAAQLACRATLERALSRPPGQLLAPDAWVSLLWEVDAAVQADADAGYTTLVAFCTASGALCGASCGDSRALAVSGGRAHDLTARQAKNPPVGSGAAVFVPFEAGLAAPWAVLAISDGVWKYVGWDRVLESAMALRGQQLVEALQASARLPRSGRLQDDFTLVLLEELT